VEINITSSQNIQVSSRETFVTFQQLIDQISG
jgi:hypothetical protein